MNKMGQNQMMKVIRLNQPQGHQMVQSVHNKI